MGLVVSFRLFISWLVVFGGMKVRGGEVDMREGGVPGEKKKGIIS